VGRMDKNAFARECWALYDGRQTFDEFAVRTRDRWRQLVRYLLKRWRISRWVDTEDLEQDMLLGAWNSVWKFDPARGVALDAYVVYNAVDKAKKAMHRYRGAKRSGNADANPSRMEFGFHERADDEHGGERWAEEHLAQEPSHEDRVEVREAIDRALRHCRTEAEREVVLAVVKTDDLAAAAEALYADPEARRRCRMGSEKQAARVVVRAAREVAERLAVVEAA